MTLMLFELGKLMPEWYPKISKLGVLPNHAHDPRKPAPLGIVLKSPIECESGVIARNDVVQNSE